MNLKSKSLYERAIICQIQLSVGSMYWWTLNARAVGLKMKTFLRTTKNHYSSCLLTAFFHYFCFAKSIKQSFVIGVSAIYFPTFLIVDIKQSSIIYLSTELKCWDRAEFFGWIELLGLIKENRNSLESSSILILKTNSIIVFVWNPRKPCCLNIEISDFFKIVF